MRTLRQRPAVVGRTDDGATVYEVRSIRLVLSPGATHFQRLVTCARCGREVPGSFILGPADLDRPSNPVFCDRCVRSPLPARPEVSRERAPAPVAPPAPAPEPPGGPEVDHARRLTILEAQLAEVLSRLASPADAGELERLSEQVADVVRGQNAELAKTDASVAELRADMHELGESNRALAGVQGQLDGRMVELGAQVNAHPGPDIDATLHRALDAFRAEVRIMIDAAAQPLQVVLADALDQLRSEVASLRQRIDDESAALARGDPGIARELAELRARMSHTDDVAAALELLRAELSNLEQRRRDEGAALAALLEAQRRELTQALHDVAHETLLSVAEPLRDLTKARDEFERRLQALQRTAEEEQLRLEALSTSAAAGASRLEALEQELQTSVQRLIDQVDANRERREKPAPRLRRPPGLLLESLERQLREAEERLGKI